MIIKHRSWEKYWKKEFETCLKFFRQCAVKVIGKLANGAVKEIVRKVGTRNSECKHRKEKISYNADCVNLETRNVFPTSNITMSIIEYANRFNQYGIRDQIIDKMQ